MLKETKSAVFDVGRGLFQEKYGSERNKRDGVKTLSVSTNSAKAPYRDKNKVLSRCRP